MLLESREAELEALRALNLPMILSSRPVRAHRGLISATAVSLSRQAGGCWMKPVQQRPL